jgi:putative DNA primase/helicase
MSLRTIVQTLGGDLYDRGRRANIPAPGHSAADRSVSLLLENNRIVVHTFGDGDWKGVLDHLRAHGLIDAANAPVSLAFAVAARVHGEAPSGRERRVAAVRIWEAGRPLGRSLAARHCRVRGLEGDLPGPGALRYGPETPVSAYRDSGPTRPALLAGIQRPDGVITAVEITYLAPNGRRAHDLRLSRKTIGVAPGGCAVRLDPLAEDMLVGEGVFTTRSASARFGLPGWALMSTETCGSGRRRRACARS